MHPGGGGGGGGGGSGGSGGSGSSGRSAGARCGIAFESVAPSCDWELELEQGQGQGPGQSQDNTLVHDALAPGASAGITGVQPGWLPSSWVPQHIGTVSSPGHKWTAQWKG